MSNRTEPIRPHQRKGWTTPAVQRISVRRDVKGGSTLRSTEDGFYRTS